MPNSQTTTQNKSGVDHGDAYEGPVTGEVEVKERPRFFPVLNRDDAGVRFVRDYGDPARQIKPGYFIAFDEKPAPDVLAEIKPLLKDAGTRWDSEVQGWVREYSPNSRFQVENELRDTANAVANKILDYRQAHGQEVASRPAR